MVSELQEFKIEKGSKSVRAIRQWNRDLKAEYMPFNEKRTSLVRALEEKEKRESMREEEEMTQRKIEREQLLRGHMLDQEKQIWEERMKTELEIAEKKRKQD